MVNERVIQRWPIHIGYYSITLGDTSAANFIAHTKYWDVEIMPQSIDYKTHMVSLTFISGIHFFKSPLMREIPRLVRLIAWD